MSARYPDPQVGDVVRYTSTSGRGTRTRYVVTEVRDDGLDLARISGPGPVLQFGVRPWWLQPVRVNAKGAEVQP